MWRMFYCTTDTVERGHQYTLPLLCTACSFYVVLLHIELVYHDDVSTPYNINYMEVKPRLSTM